MDTPVDRLCVWFTAVAQSWNQVTAFHRATAVKLFRSIEIAKPFRIDPEPPASYWEPECSPAPTVSVRPVPAIPEARVA